MKEQMFRAKQKDTFDKHYGVRDVPPLDPGTLVWMPDRESEGMVMDEVAPIQWRPKRVDLPIAGTHRNSSRRQQMKQIQPFEGVKENVEKLTDSTLHGLELRTENK